MQQTRNSATNSYTFTTAPRAVAGKKSKFRDPQENLTNNLYNLMVDPRVRRGLTLAQPTTIEVHAQIDDISSFRREKENTRKQKSQKKDANQNSGPEPVDGRQHMEIQTEFYLEELTDRPVEKDRSTQTDTFLDRPPSPLFIPKKSGEDAETQILVGELFDFDTEVEPILSVLVTKTLEQSLLEIRDEEELRNLRTHQEEMAARKAAELKEAQRLEELERRREEEKEKRLKKEIERKEQEKQEKERVAAREYAKQYLESLTPNVFNKLTDMGYFYDPIVKEVDNSFMPWLMHQTGCKLIEREKAALLVDGKNFNLFWALF
jgi:hypothetical protein